MSEFLTARQVQKLLSIDRTTIYRMLKDGRLNGIKDEGGEQLTEISNCSDFCELIMATLQG